MDIRIHTLILCVLFPLTSLASLTFEDYLPIPVKLHSTIQEVLADPPCTLEGKIKPGKRTQVISCKDYPLRGKNTTSMLWFYDGKFEKVMYQLDKSRLPDITSYIEEDFGKPEKEPYLSNEKAWNFNKTLASRGDNEYRSNEISYHQDSILLRVPKNTDWFEMIVISDELKEKEKFPWG